MLKSGEDIIADIKEIKSEQDVVGYFFHDPLVVKTYSPEELVFKYDGTTATIFL